MKRPNLTIKLSSVEAQTTAAVVRPATILLLSVTDSDNDGTFELLKTTTLIESGSDIQLYFKSLTASQITFSAVGMPLETGSIELCDSRGTAHAKAMVLNMGGQLRHMVAAERSEIACS